MKPIRYSWRMMNRVGLLACLLWVATSGQLAAIPLGYTVRDLTPLIGPYSHVSSLNDHGELTGHYREDLSGDSREEIFRYTHNHGFELLGSLGGTIANGRKINNVGQVAGDGLLPGQPLGGISHGFLYTPGLGMVDLGTLGGLNTEVWDLNNLGQVTGISEVNGQGSERAFRYTPGLGMENLGGLMPGGGSQAWGINDQGTVVGNALVFVEAADQNRTHAVRYTDAEGMVDLGALWSKGNSLAFAINNNGMIVGEATVFGGAWEAVIWMDDQIRSIGSLGGHTTAWDVNDAGIVIGDGTTSEGTIRSFLWTEETGMLDLNSLIDPASGWTIISAGEINNANQIIGYGAYQGAYRYFMLDPIPEPSTWALLALGGLLWLGRRWMRKN